MGGRAGGGPSRLQDKKKEGGEAEAGMKLCWTINGSHTGVPEGIRPEFSFTERKPPGSGELFRFLFHGAWDYYQTGLDLALIAFEAWFQSGRMPENCQLVLKTYGSPFRGAITRLGPRYAPWPGVLPGRGTFMLRVSWSC